MEFSHFPVIQGPTRLPTSLRIALTLVISGGLFGAGHNTFADDGVNPLDASLEQQVRDFAKQGMRKGSLGITRIDIAVGQLDARLRLTACQRVEPYLPAGTRLWGKSRIGLRCTLGVKAWNVFLPITVKVFGPVLVAAAALPAGSTLSAADLVQGEADLAEESSDAITDAGVALGRTLSRSMSPGQSLRVSHLKSRQWFAAGEAVSVLAIGEGFAVASQGEALTAGVEGQPARVRTAGGRIVSGMPVAERRLELQL